MRELPTQAKKLQTKRRYTPGHHHGRVFERSRYKSQSEVTKNKTYSQSQQSGTRTDSEAKGLRRKREFHGAALCVNTEDRDMRGSCIT